MHDEGDGGEGDHGEKGVGNAQGDGVEIVRHASLDISPIREGRKADDDEGEGGERDVQESSFHELSPVCEFEEVGAGQGAEEALSRMMPLVPPFAEILSNVKSTKIGLPVILIPGRLKLSMLFSVPFMISPPSTSLRIMAFT